MLEKYFTPARLGLLSTTTFGLVQFLVIALYPSIADATQLAVSDVVLCFTLGSLLFIWGSPFWASKSDSLGRPAILRVGLFGLSLSFALLLLLIHFKVTGTQGVMLLLTSRVLYGLTAPAINSVVQAWWRDQAGDKTKHMLSHSQGLNLGRVLAPILVLVLQGELTALLWSLFVWTLLLALSSTLAPKQSTTASVSAPRGELSLPLFFAMAATTYIGLIHSTMASHLKRVFALDSSDSAILMSQVLLLSGLFVLATQAVLKKLPRLSPQRLLWIALPSWPLATFLLTNIQTQLQLWLAVVFFSLGMATIAPAYLAMMPSGGKASGLMSASQTLGLTLGGALGFFVLNQTFTLEWPLYVLCGFLWFCGNILTKPKECCG